MQPGARSQAQAAEDAKLQPIDLTLEGAYGNECWTEHSVILTGTAQTGIELEALVG